VVALKNKAVIIPSYHKRKEDRMGGSAGSKGEDIGLD